MVDVTAVSEDVANFEDELLEALDAALYTGEGAPPEGAMRDRRNCEELQATVNLILRCVRRAAVVARTLVGRVVDAATPEEMKNWTSLRAFREEVLSERQRTATAAAILLDKMTRGLDRK